MSQEPTLFFHDWTKKREGTYIGNTTKREKKLSCQFSSLSHTQHATCDFYVQLWRREGGRSFSTIGVFASNARFVSNRFRSPLILLPTVFFAHPTGNIQITLSTAWFVRPARVVWITNHLMQTRTLKWTLTSIYFNQCGCQNMWPTIMTTASQIEDTTNSLSETIQCKKGSPKKKCEREGITCERGIWTRMSENIYKQMEMAAPARKLYSSRRLSFDGMKTVFSVLVNSKIRTDTCISKSREQQKMQQ